MRYERPEVRAEGPAVDSVQASMKPSAGVVDNELGLRFTATAYEADE
jgi:hypothetical protein